MEVRLLGTRPRVGERRRWAPRGGRSQVGSRTGPEWAVRLEIGLRNGKRSSWQPSAGTRALGALGRYGAGGCQGGGLPGRAPDPGPRQTPRHGGQGCGTVFRQLPPRGRPRQLPFRGSRSQPEGARTPSAVTTGLRGQGRAGRGLHESCPAPVTESRCREQLAVLGGQVRCGDSPPTTRVPGLQKSGRKPPPRPARPPHLLHRGPRGAGQCASSPSSSSAGASGPSWTPRGSSPQTPAGGQSVGCTGTGLQQTRGPQCYCVLGQEQASPHRASRNVHAPDPDSAREQHGTPSPRRGDPSQSFRRTGTPGPPAPRPGPLTHVPPTAASWGIPRACAGAHATPCRFVWQVVDYD